MKSAKRNMVASLVVALALAGYSLPSMSQEKMEGAKGLFLAQLESPDKSLNTGLQYWIELHRDGKTQRVSNKFAFKSGDQIKFHVTANINGYAYILLKSGSRGEQSVLFPDPTAGDENRVQRGKDYILPCNDFLTFDENPGTEKVSLVLSRTPIDAQAFLNNEKEAPTLIASAVTGAKDLIPQRVLVHYTEDKPVQVADAPPGGKDKSKPKVDKTKKKPATAEGDASVQKVAKKNPPQGAASKLKVKSDAQNAGTVTVVSELPGNVLHVDVDLHHI